MIIVAPVVGVLLLVAALAYHILLVFVREKRLIKVSVRRVLNDLLIKVFVRY